MTDTAKFSEKTKISVDFDADWREYTDLPDRYPDKYDGIGVISDEHGTGALIRKRRGQKPYLLAVGDMTRPVDGRMIGNVGRPYAGNEGKQRPITLYPQHFEIAKEIGDGNISKGVRRALEIANSMKNT